MPTPAERQALLFLAGVIVLGAGVRVVRAARSDGSNDSAARFALARQLAAVDSARSDHAEGKGGRRKSSGSKSSATKSPRSRRTTRDTTPQPSGLAPTVIRTQAGALDALTSLTPIDLDVASASDIETLPRIGPALAKRIVEDREQNGPFGSLEGFERVRGVGPSLVALLRERVTFSGTARPSNAVVDNRLRSPPPRSKSSRRERRP